jgi:hypothetical protein
MGSAAGVRNLGRAAHAVCARLMGKTLKHRESHPERVFPEVPRGSGRARQALLALRCWQGNREVVVHADEVSAAADRPRAREGERPKEEKPKIAGVSRVRVI